MRKRTVKLVGLMLILAMVMSLSTSTYAAKKKTTKKNVAKSYSVKVPASILNGSDVTANRKFKVLGYKETVLAGIKLGDSNKKVLVKYGNPSRVIVHQEPQQTNMNGMGGMQGDMTGMGMNGMNNTMPGMDNTMGMNGMGNTMPGMGNTGMNGMGNTMGMGNTGMNMGATTMPGMGNTMGGNNLSTAGAITSPITSSRAGATPTTGMPGAMMSDGMPGVAGSGMLGMAGMNGQSQSIAVPDFMGSSERIASTSICWQYDLPSGVQLEFIVKEGKVSQITVLSLYPWKLANLKSGLMIGDTYKLVTYLWGINYKQQQIGSFSRATYWPAKGCALIFLNKKVVGMTVAAGDPII